MLDFLVDAIAGWFGAKPSWGWLMALILVMIGLIWFAIWASGSGG